MTLGRVIVLVGIAILVLVANVAASILYMVFYGHVIDPGHEEAYYQEHIQIAAPYCSIVAGAPLMFLAGWWVGRRWDVRSAIIVWVAYAAIDLAIIFSAAAMTVGIGLVFSASILIKLAAVCLGALVAGRLRDNSPSGAD